MGFVKVAVRKAVFLFRVFLRKLRMWLIIAMMLVKLNFLEGGGQT